MAVLLHSQFLDAWGTPGPEHWIRQRSQHAGAALAPRTQPWQTGSWEGEALAPGHSPGVGSQEEGGPRPPGTNPSRSGVTPGPWGPILAHRGGVEGWYWACPRVQFCHVGLHPARKTAPPHSSGPEGQKVEHHWSGANREDGSTALSGLPPSPSCPFLLLGVEMVRLEGIPTAGRRQCWGHWAGFLTREPKHNIWLELEAEP